MQHELDLVRLVVLAADLQHCPAVPGGDGDRARLVIRVLGARLEGRFRRREGRRAVEGAHAAAVGLLLAIVPGISGEDREVELLVFVTVLQVTKVSVKSDTDVAKHQDLLRRLALNVPVRKVFQEVSQRRSRHRANLLHEHQRHVEDTRSRGDEDLVGPIRHQGGFLVVVVSLYLESVAVQVLQFFVPLARVIDSAWAELVD
mmetsp:Transcript_100372/g.289865  ORF Transcript_100372/g.289865 Transcript_100372/m.289865 type:complete len:202 (+) Transcript_100372:1613-2218(+)